MDLLPILPYKQDWAKHTDQVQFMAKEADADVKSALNADGYHRSWQQIYRVPEREPYYRYCFDRIARLYRQTPNGSVLDAGCGTGHHIRHLTERAFDVVGVDFSPQAIASCKENLANLSHGRVASVQEADLLGLPFESGAFHRVLCWGVLMHIPSVEVAIQEICRVTAKGGVIAIGELNDRAWQLRFAHLARRMLRRSPRGDHRKTPSGIETWEGVPGNMLVARKANIDWHIDTFLRHGAILRDRFAGEFTEWYAECDKAWQRNFVHLANRFWWQMVRLPGPAFANVLLFQKQ